eukprot:2039681-Rhodomonas_salina.1
MLASGARGPEFDSRNPPPPSILFAKLAVASPFSRATRSRDLAFLKSNDTAMFRNKPPTHV